jgi:hypothetical protein
MPCPPRGGAAPSPHVTKMAQPFQMTSDPQDPRAVRILAKNIYREFRANGFSERDVMALASELLSLVTSEVKGQRGSENK